MEAEDKNNTVEHKGNGPIKTKPPQNKWDLIIGIGLLLFGGYRLYNVYFNGLELEPFRMILTFGFIGIGCFNLYKYFKAGQA